jgi:hypothetical protein
VDILLLDVGILEDLLDGSESLAEEVDIDFLGVTGGSEDFEDIVVDAQERDIKGTTAEIVDDDPGLTALFVESVGDGGGGRLVDDAEDVKTCDDTDVVVEVGGDGDEGGVDFFAEVVFGDLLHLGENHGEDLETKSANAEK